MRKFNFRESQTLDFQFWDKYGAVSYTEILYMIQSNRVENASNASMPLYTTQSIFVYRGTQVYNLHIVQCVGSISTSVALAQQQDQRISNISASAATVHQQQQCISSNIASAATLHQQQHCISNNNASQYQLHALEGISAHIHHSIQVILAYKHRHCQTPPDKHQTPPDTTRHAPDTTRHARDVRQWLCESVKHWK